MDSLVLFGVTKMVQDWNRDSDGECGSIRFRYCRFCLWTRWLSLLLAFLCFRLVLHISLLTADRYGPALVGTESGLALTLRDLIEHRHTGQRAAFGSWCMKNVDRMSSVTHTIGCYNIKSKGKDPVTTSRVLYILQTAIK